MMPRRARQGARSAPVRRSGPARDGSRAPTVESGPGAPAQGRELRARGRRTLHKLLDAGSAVFAQRGYHAARVDDIVKLAKTSHGTFYLYFANKEDLFRALATEVAREMMAHAESLPSIDRGDAGRRDLRAWLEHFTELYERYGAVIRAWTEAEIGGSEFGRLGTDVFTEFARVLANRVRDISPELDPVVAALAFATMIERFNYYVITRQVDVDRDAMLDTLAAVTHAALFGGGAGTRSTGGA
jgi:AcrR family transcriptional regulator